MEFDYIYRLKEKYYNCYWIDMVFSLINAGVSNEVQSISFVETNIELIKSEIKLVIKEMREQRVGGKKVDLYKSLPKILGATK